MSEASAQSEDTNEADSWQSGIGSKILISEANDIAGSNPV